MSRIDTPKPNVRPQSTSESPRLTRPTGRASTPSSSQSIDSLSALATHNAIVEVLGREQEAEPEDQLAIHAVKAADLAPLFAAGNDRLMVDLSRIEVTLSSQISASNNAELTMALQVGRDMIAETVRRLRLLQPRQHVPRMHSRSADQNFMGRQNLQGNPPSQNAKREDYDDI